MRRLSLVLIAAILFFIPGCIKQSQRIAVQFEQSYPHTLILLIDSAPPPSYIQTTPANLVLTISAPDTDWNFPAITPYITNQGTDSVVLVYPGDGSESGWRTPIIGWSTINVADDTSRHPAEVPLWQGIRCGNMNPLRADEVFVLQPGESVSLGPWVHYPDLGTDQSTRVVFYYQNTPGTGQGWGDSLVLARFDESVSCFLVSNELTFITKPYKE